jgi:ABC-type multidrug transport system ATPase subunit
MPALAVHHLVKRYRNGTLANDDISLEVAPGQLYALLGPNGAGKTTLVRQVLGLLRPTSGAIAVDGVDVVADPAFARRNIGFLSQGQFTAESIHVDEMIVATARLRGLSRAEASRRTEDVIARLDLGSARRTPLSAASGGIRRLAGFAAAVVAGARILVLDEPTNDVDPARRQLLWSTLAELVRDGVTVLLVTHNLAEAERVIDRFAIIDRGRILHEGTPASMRSLVTDRMRLDVVSTVAVVPHPALQPDAAGAYLFDPADLGAVSDWLHRQREAGSVVDFRIGPPTLDDIYAAALGPAAHPLPEVA